MNPNKVKEILLSKIRQVAEHPHLYCVNPGRDFTRKRKLPFEQLLKGIIGMGGQSLPNELLDMYHYSSHTLSTSAFVQQRSKLKPEAFEDIFRTFTEDITDGSNEKIKILAADGTDLHIATNPLDTDSYYLASKKQQPYNLLHINALYDLSQRIYHDAVIQKRHKVNEPRALCSMVDRSTIKKALVIADRGYESYNVMAHIQEKGWNFLIRVRDGRRSIKGNLDLPNTPEFDLDIKLYLTRKQSKEVMALCKKKNQCRRLPTDTVFDYLPPKSKYCASPSFYELNFRIVQFPISKDSYETVLTNLDRREYSSEKIKLLYALRWGIETSFRDLKYTVGLTKLHAKKVTCVQQEIFARLIMYNFSEAITSQVAIKKKEKKYVYKANFCIAVHMCRAFYHGKTTSPDLEAVIARALVPIRPGRQQRRKLSPKIFQGFLYRIS